MMPRKHQIPDPVTVEFTTTSGAGSYPVWIASDLLRDASTLVRECCPAHRYSVVSDTQVADRYGVDLVRAMKAAGLTADLFRFAAGEWNKTREIWGQVTDSMLASGVGRDAAVVALGGGVVGDVAGFVAATYMRGIPVVQIPTTLLAMVDSSVGGKTGVDTTAGKNLVGIFHQPAGVIVDPKVLATLPDHQLAAGLAEVLKHGLICDAAYFDRVSRELEGVFGRDQDLLTELIRRSVDIKAEVVSRDTEESGYRRILNFGHTVAHALEAVTGYELLHGEAVAIGLAAEAEIGRRLGVTPETVSAAIRESLMAARLPIDIDSGVEEERFFEALSRDKKRQAGRSRFVLLAELGQVAGEEADGWTVEVEHEVVREALFS